MFPRAKQKREMAGVILSAFLLYLRFKAETQKCMWITRHLEIAITGAFPCSIPIRNVSTFLVWDDRYDTCLTESTESQITISLPGQEGVGLGHDYSIGYCCWL